MIFSVSSVSSSVGHTMMLTSRVAVSFVLNAPGRCTFALSCHTTEPYSQRMVGGAFEGMLNEIGYEYVPVGAQ